MFKFANFTLFVRSNPKKSINYIVENYKNSNNKVLLEMGEADIELLKKAFDTFFNDKDIVLDKIITGTKNDDALDNTLFDYNTLVASVIKEVQDKIVNNHSLHSLYNTAGLSKKIINDIFNIKKQFQDKFNFLIRNAPPILYAAKDDINLKQKREQVNNEYVSLFSDTLNAIKSAITNDLESAEEFSYSQLQNNNPESTYQIRDGVGADNRPHKYGTTYTSNVGGNTISRLEADSQFVNNLGKLANADTSDNVERNLKSSIKSALNSAIVELNVISKTPAHRVKGRPTPITAADKAKQSKKARKQAADEYSVQNPFVDVSSVQADSTNIIVEDKIVLDDDQLFTIDLLSRLTQDNTYNYLNNGQLFHRGKNNDIEILTKDAIEQLIVDKKLESDLYKLKTGRDNRSIVFDKAYFDAKYDDKDKAKYHALDNTDSYDIAEKIKYSNKIDDKSATYKKIEDITDYVYNWLKTNINSIISDGKIKWTSLVPIINDAVDSFDTSIDDDIHSASQPLKGTREVPRKRDTTSPFDSEAILLPTKYDKIKIVGLFDYQIIQYEELNDLYNSLSEDQKQRFVKHIEELDESEVSKDIHTLCYLLLMAERYNVDAKEFKNIINLVNNFTEIHDWSDDQLAANLHNLFVLANTDNIEEIIEVVNALYNKLDATKRMQTSKFKFLINTITDINNGKTSLDELINDASKPATSIQSTTSPAPVKKEEPVAPAKVEEPVAVPDPIPEPAKVEEPNPKKKTKSYDDF